MGEEKKQKRPLTKFSGQRLRCRACPGVCLSKFLAAADDLQGEVGWRGVGHVKGIHDAATAGEDTFLGNLLVAEVATRVAKNVVGVADEIGGLAALEAHEAALVVLVVHHRLAQLVILEDTPETQEAVGRVVEVVVVWVHHGIEHDR